jgi:hypothetical protein
MASAPVAIDIKGLKGTIKSLKDFPEEIAEMKAVHRRVGEMVLKDAVGRMSSVSGDLRGSYKAGNIKSGAKISSSLPYAGVSEFGGTIPRYNSATRTKHKETAKSAGMKSYYIYPAVEQNRSEIVDIYEKEIAAIAARHSMEG